jgi:hypothetical protein
MRRVMLVVGSAVALTLVGCGGKPKKEEVAECVFPQTTQRAPGWVCNQSGIEGVAVSEMGSYQKTPAGVAFQQDQATLSGRARLAQRFRAVVTSGMKQAIQTTGAGQSATVDQVASTAANSVSAETLVGSRVYRTAYSPDGTMFVLVGIDEAGAKRVVEQAVATSMNNNRAQWQQLQGAKMQTDLAAEVYKLGVQSMR